MKRIVQKTFLQKAGGAAKKTIGFLVVALILAFIFYHLYSVFNFAKDFKQSTGISSNK
jgi:hypothetical protein